MARRGRSATPIGVARIATACAALLLVSGCGGGGDAGGPTGPGDVGHHFPLQAGDARRYLVPGPSEAVPPAIGWETVSAGAYHGRAAWVVRESTQADSAASYYVLDGDGLLLLGGDGFEPPLSQVLPYYELRFPLDVGRTDTTVDRHGLGWGDDVDGDGLEDHLDLRHTVAVVAVEDVDEPAGRFTDCVHVVRTAKATLIGTRVGIIDTETATEEVWLAPGVGPVRYVSHDPDGSTSEVHLSGFAVGGARHGVTADLALAGSLGVGDSDLLRPGRPALVPLDDGWLLVTRRLAEGEATAATLLVRLDPGGAPLGSAELDDGTWPALASNGTGWLLAHDGRNDDGSGNVHAHLLDAAGAPVGGPIPLGPGDMPAVASDGSGWLVVWSQFVDGQQYDLAGALVDADGTSSLSFMAFAAPGEQVFPAAAFDGQQFVVAFRDTRSGSGPAADSHVSATRISTAGEVRDPDGIAVATGPGILDGPALASDGAGTLVAWSDFQGYGAMTIHAARLSAEGALLDGPPEEGGIPVEARPGDLGWPSAVFDGTTYRLAWAADPYRPTAGIYSARISPPGVALDAPPVLLAPPPLDGWSSQGRVAYPVLARNGQTTLVAWLSEQAGGKFIAGALVEPPAGPP